VKSEEFIREVDEELRRDRFAMLWRRYGAFVLSVAVLIVVGTAAKVGWDQWRQRERAAEALRFAGAERALAAGQGAEAAQQFAALAAEGGTGFAALARLKEAEAKLGQKDEAGALTALDQLATTTGDDPILRDLATLLAVERRLDKADPAELTKTLEPLAAGDSPWRHQARELLALTAIRAGDLDKARSLLGDLSREVGVAPSQQRRAAELLQAIGGSVAQASS
jgi:hypothetical protein